MIPILLALPGAEAMAGRVATQLECETGVLSIHRFPDGESCPQFKVDVKDRAVVLVCALDDPDRKTMELYLAASVARELGASSVGLIAPYLPYMRQDARFAPGQGITSIHYARLISSCCDWMVTVDPHLHRHRSLSEVYTIRTEVVPAAPAIAAWLVANVARPVVVGPDEESEQWVAKVAAAAGCPHIVLRKERSGDRDVTVSPPDAALLAGHTPVVVDDIASTAHTMIAATGRLLEAGADAPLCVAVHALFVDDACDLLMRAGARRIASCNTVGHASNLIDMAPALAAAARML